MIEVGTFQLFSAGELIGDSHFASSLRPCLCAILAMFSLLDVESLLDIDDGVDYQNFRQEGFGVCPSIGFKFSITLLDRMGRGCERWAYTSRLYAIEMNTLSSLLLLNSTYQHFSYCNYGEPAWRCHTSVVHHCTFHSIFDGWRSEGQVIWHFHVFNWIFAVIGSAIILVSNGACRSV